jgi:predicted aminopeptidase
MNRQIQYNFKLILLLIIIFLSSGCASISYYSQSMKGQFEVLHKRQPINDLLQNNTISNELRNKLNTVVLLRNFSVSELALPENNSYRTYADLKRKYVIWNIFANEEFSLESLNWCYLIVGCLSYRGYFSKSKAEYYATQLKQKGYDIYLGGVSAYSTLGWFDDPVLNTMLQWNESYLATVMFHELAHQQFYIKDDTEFNESYADAVAHIGVMRWFEQKQNKTQLLEYQQYQQRENAFVELVIRYKSKLQILYQSSEDEEKKRKRKKEIFQSMKNEYKKMTESWGKNPYEKWFSSELNNAKLASVVTYRKYVPAFLDIYAKLKNDLSKFYSFTESLSNCKPMKRKEILKKRKIEFEC